MAVDKRATAGRPYRRRGAHVTRYARRPAQTGAHPIQTEIDDRRAFDTAVLDRVGKQAKPRPALSDNQFVELLMVAGYKDGDLERLGKAQSLGVQEACDMTVKLYSAPSSLTPDKGGVLARWLLTVPQ